MKILWVVNSIFPYPADKLGIPKTCFGGWLNSMHEEIIKNNKIDIAIATTCSCKKFLKFDDGNTIYYLIPDKKTSKYNKKIINNWKSIIEDFKPDILHIHGTEYSRGLSLINGNFDIPVVTSIQGLSGSVANVYYGNISFIDIIKNITIRDVLKLNTIFDGKKDFKNRAIYEKQIIKKSNYIIGRTLWDKSNVIAISPDKKYYNLNECLRTSFYNEKVWDIKKIQRHSIFCSQASYPIKGLHILLKSISLLKKSFPDIKLYVGGINIVDESSVIKKIKTTGYGKYIKKLIKKYDIKQNVEFTGLLSAEQVADRLLKTHVFVSPSFIENESNSLTEASVLGVPAVGSYVGGVTERIIHGETGFYYPVTESSMLAYYIKKIFSEDDLAMKFSVNARKKAKLIVDRQKNYEDLYNIYTAIINEKKSN